MNRCRTLTLPVLCLLVCVPSLFAQQGPDDKQREKMVRELAKQGSQAIPDLSRYLKEDPSVDVRVEAVKAIVDIGTQNSLDPLVLATSDNDAEVQARATDGLVNFYYPGYIRTGLTASIKRIGTGIKGKFTDTNDQIIDPYVEVRPDVIEALGKLARGGVSLEVRANAARAIGVLRGKAALPDLVAALRTADTLVTYEALVAMKKIGDQSVAPQITFLLRDLDEKVQITAIEVTGLLQNKAALPQLRDVLAQTKDDKVMAAAVTAIAMLPDDSSRNLYQQYMQDRQDDLRTAAAEGFARLGNQADVPMLQNAFRDEKKMNARLADAFALVKLGNRDMTEFGALRYLVNTLNSSSWNGVAWGYLVELAREDSVRTAIYPSMHERTRSEKVQLASILARSGQQDALPILESLSRDGDIEVAQAGLRALRVLKTRLG